MAVKTTGGATTYQALERAANRIARAILLRRGNSSEPIAILLENGIDAVAAILGVLKAGKFFVAIEPAFPGERIQYIFDDSQAPMMITDSRHLQLGAGIVGADKVVLNVDAIEESQCDDPIDVVVRPMDLAALMYTSGSTGAPKGIIETHRHGLDNARLNTLATGIVPSDRLSLLHSICFSAAKFSLHTALLNGACLCPFDVKTEGIERLVNWLVAEEITVLHCPPALFRQLAEPLARKGHAHKLRLLLLTGAPIVRGDFILYKQNFSPRTSLGVAMGSTETGQICTAVVNHDFAFPDEGSPAGYPYEGRRIQLLDDQGRAAAPGEAGEIVVKGPHLTEGYWRNPELTKARFMLDANSSGEQVYLTGDLGRLSADGFLIHLGRKDLIAKIRGYRVSLVEIEGRILDFPGVREVAVIEWSNAEADAFLAAYIPVGGGPKPTHSALRAFLATKLPDYMIPSVSVFLDELPRSNGKIDRASLSRPSRTRPNLAQPSISANTEYERILVEIWQEVLDIRPIGTRDNFLDLGGHSLAATRIASRVLERFRLDVPLHALFQTPTIMDMAIVITLHQGKTLDEKKMSQLLTEIESLTEEQARQFLDRFGPTGV